ncbi:MAG: C69 family dipeptidase [Fidelibacterota bacterium]|nr:MAG: C69 family dipeptidase [Candidatus Neomarinimicrobiota bacterium]
MVSTLVISPASSPDGAAYFARNSNRDPGECQLVVTIPAVERDSNTLLKCTHITISQVPHRFGVLLHKPWWCWGGDTGANEKGVVIGGESIATRDHESESGLIGPDLVRLGLERGGTAEEALGVITALLQTHGQGGACRLGDRSVGCDSSFILADANEVWLLETAGRHWAAKRIQAMAVLSSRLTLATDYDRSSYALTQYAQLKGWSGRRENVHFAAAFGQQSRLRSTDDRWHRDFMLDKLARLDSERLVFDLLNLLRLRKGTHPRWRSKSDMALYASGMSRSSQTSGSMVARVSARRRDFFLTGTSAPDLSVFKPVYFSLPLEADLAGVDLSRYHADSLWWRQETLHRAMFLASRLDTQYLKERDELEKSMIVDLAAQKGRQLAQARRSIQQNLLEWEASWSDRLATSKSLLHTCHPFTRFWKRQNRRDGITL